MPHSSHGFTETKGKQVSLFSLKNPCPQGAFIYGYITQVVVTLAKKQKNKGEKEHKEVLFFPPKKPKCSVVCSFFHLYWPRIIHRLLTTAVSCSSLNSCGNGLLMKSHWLGLQIVFFLISLSMRWHYNGIDLGQYISSLHVRTSRRGKTKSNEKTTKVNFGFHSFYSRIFPVNSENPFFITNTFVLKGHWVETRSLLRCQEYKHRLKIVNVIWKRILSFCQTFHYQPC